jgi:hypothetical protein
MAVFPTGERTRVWIKANDRFRRDILDRLRDSGPLRSRDLPDTSEVPWASTGWTNNRNVTQMLEILVRRGEVAITRREGRERIWDLAERVYPSNSAPLPHVEAQQLRNHRRLRALGIARPTAPEQPMEPVHVGAAGVEATVEGVPGSWRVDQEALDTLEATVDGGRTALLSPFDRLVHDRVRAQALFGFEYVLEMYKPAGQRRWGYFALPVLHGDQMIGKVDALADRKQQRLVVNAIHEDVPFTVEMRDGVEAELDDLAAWLGFSR